MDFGFSQEQEMLRATARKFLENECPSTFVRERELGVQIAQVLNIEPSSVTRRLKSARVKLGAATYPELAVRYYAKVPHGT